MRLLVFRSGFRWLIPVFGCGMLGLGFLHVWTSPQSPSFTITVVNSANLQTGPIAPGEIVIIYPSDAGPLKLSEWSTIFPRKKADFDYIDRHLNPTVVGETRVLFDGTAVPIVYSVRGQAEVLAPAEIAGRHRTHIVLEYRGVASAPVTLPVADSSPALYTLDATGKGPAALLNETGCCNSKRNPATRGSVVSLFATGEGKLVRPHTGSGMRALERRLLASLHLYRYRTENVPVSVSVGGVPAEIAYSGSLGQLMVNFRIPLNAPVGDAVPLAVKVGDRWSTDGVTMSVRARERTVLMGVSNPALADALKSSGYRVLGPGDSDDAADLIVVDAMSPESSMLDELRRKRPPVRVVALASRLTPGALHSADLLGAQAVLTSQQAPALWVAKIGDVLRERAAVY